jgi:hypothetical protein
VPLENFIASHVALYTPFQTVQGAAEVQVVSFRKILRPEPANRDQRSLFQPHNQNVASLSRHERKPIKVLVTASRAKGPDSKEVAVSLPMGRQLGSALSAYDS